MLLALLQLAFGSQCIIGPTRLVVDADALHTGGTLSVWLVGGRGALPAHLASRLRLRGPDGVLVPLRVDHLLGEVRLTPVGGLRPGAHVLEVWAGFTADGERIELDRSGAVAASGWFPYESWEVADLALPGALEAPTGARWSRFHNARQTSAGPVTALQVSASAAPGTRVEVEIDGVGPVAGGRATADGRFGSRLGRDMCSHHPIDLPRAGDLRVRLVAVGADGARAPGPWEVLGPSTPVDFGPFPDAAAPSGERAPVAGIATWTPIEHRPEPGEPVGPGTSCGRLVPRGEPVQLEADADDGYLVDADQRFRRVALVSGQLRLDGRDVGFVLPSREAAQLHLVGAGPTLTIGVHDTRAEWLYVLRVDGTRVLERTEVFGVRRVTAFDLDGAELRLAWTEGHGVRWTQRFDHALQALEPPREVVEPLTVDPISGLASGAGWGIAVNGHPIDALDLHHFKEGLTVHQGRVYIPAYAQGGERLVVARPDGTVAWSLDLRDPITLNGLAVDDQGVHLQVTDFRADGRPRTVHTYTHDGEPIVPSLPFPSVAPSPPVREAVPARRLVHGGRTVVVRLGTVAVEEGGHLAPSTKLPAGALVAVRPDGAEVVWHGLADWRSARRSDPPQGWWQQPLVCSGQSLGLPDVFSGRLPSGRPAGGISGRRRRRPPTRPALAGRPPEVWTGPHPSP